MIISEKQIMLLIKYLEISLDGNITPYGEKAANELLADIINQQPSEKKEINDDLHKPG